MYKNANTDIVWGESLFATANLHSIKEYKMYFHNEIELLLMIKGKVRLEVADQLYTLVEDDFVLINSNQLHTTKQIAKDNIMLSIKIEPRFFYGMFQDLKNIDFIKNFNKNQKSKEKEIFRLKQLMAKIVLTMDKKDEGYKFKIGSYVYLIAETLYKDFNHIKSDPNDSVSDTNYFRLQRIIDSIYANFNKNISLKDVAEQENLNYFYLSHFIKNHLGVSFQEFVNEVRLNEAVRLLRETNLPITEIATKSGFSNLSSFNNFFKCKYENTPSNYRKRLELPSTIIRKDKLGIDEVNKNIVLKKLKSYLENDLDDITNFKELEEVELIEIDFNQEGRDYIKHWTRHVTLGKAFDGLNAKWQERFIEIQKEADFDYIGFKGIFFEEMETFTVKSNGSVDFNWTYIDELIDFLLDNNAKPFIEFSFSDYKKRYPSRDLEHLTSLIKFSQQSKLWDELLTNFIKHCINRYGLLEVESWYFELWNEPIIDINSSKVIDRNQFVFYKHTVNLIKSISKNIKVGGPSISQWTNFSGQWLIEFLNYMEAEDVLIDFMSVYIFSQHYKEELLKSNQNKNNLSKNIITGDDLHLFDTIERLNQSKQDFLSKDIEIHIPKWNMASEPNNLLSDTAYMATFIVKNMLDTIDLVDSVGYWAFSDLSGDFKLDGSHFFGGLGLVNKDGIKKPSYNAYLFLNKLGSEIVISKDNYIITKNGEDIQILLYNHALLDDKYKQGDRGAISKKRRYDVFLEQNDLNINLNIKDINGRYKITTYQQNRDNGSAFDEWIKMGSPEKMNREQIAYLKLKEDPKVNIEFQFINNNYKKQVTLPIHGIEMILLEKQQ